MADGSDRDSWFIVEDPDKPAEEETKEDPSPVQDKEAEPQGDAEEAKPEADAEAEPQAEEQETKDEEPEQEEQQQPESEPAAEPEPEPETKPAEPESQQDTAQEEEESQKEPEPAAEPESESEPKPTEEVKPESEAAAQEVEEPEVKPEEPTAEEPKTEEDKEDDAGDKSSEEPEEKENDEGEVVEVEVELGTHEETKANGKTTTETEVPPEPPRTPTPEPGDDIMVGESIQILRCGTDMRKVRKNKFFPRLFFLEEDLSAVAWKSNHKKPNKARIPIANIKEVRSGRGTETFKACHAPQLPADDQCFSIIYKNGSKTVNLDLATFSVKVKEAWVVALRALIRGNNSGSSSQVRSRWLRNLFEAADRDGSGSLSVKEVLTMMKELNVSMNKKVLKQKFKDADEDGNYDGSLNFEEFCSLFRELSERQEVKTLFTSYSSKQEYMTTMDVQRFMAIEQGAHNITPEVVMGFVQRYEPTAEGKDKGWLTVDGFHQFLLGPENDVFVIDHREVYQDMSHPFPHYYLASSHNTYLMEDQLVGPSSIEGYVNALRKGCRCVELDCWDGPDGEPIIYHGHTATSKISFESVIEVIKEHAFVTSTYPVVLSIENHCSIAQQNRMAEILIDILGEALHLDTRDDNTLILPPPSALRHKILIKGKKLQKSIEEDDDMDEGEISEDDEADEIEPQHKKKEESDVPVVEPEQPATEGDTKPAEETPKPAEGEEAKTEEEKPKSEDAEAKAEEPKTEEEPKAADEGEAKPKEDSPAIVVSEDSADKDAKAEVQPAEKEAKPAEDSQLNDELKAEKQSRRLSVRLSFRSRQRRERADTASSTTKKKIKLSKKLSKLINYFQSVHFSTFEEPGKCFHMSSFGENNAMKKAMHDSAKFANYNRHQISRTYPAGTRVNSSNYDPVPMWNVGCHMVALNYQTTSEAMDLNDGKFMQNGGCGFILKPDILRDEYARYNPNDSHYGVPGTYPKFYTIKVISGQNLPKPGDKSGEIVDPYVVLQVTGVKEDKKEFKTKVVKDNGFNPEWKETFSFQVAFPEMAILRVRVMDKDFIDKDDFIGSCSVPMASIAPGYRHIQLTRGDNKLQCATIFVHVQVYDVVAPSKALIKTKTKLRVTKSRHVPENHLIGFSGIDEHFREIGTIFRQSMDVIEDLQYSMMVFKEFCGHEPQVDLLNSVRWMLEWARRSGVNLKVGPNKSSLALVTKTSDGKTIPVPHTLETMVEIFNAFLQASTEVLEKADGMAEKLEKIRSEGVLEKEALRQHLHDNGVAANYRRADQVWDNYYKTLFSLKTVAADLRRTRAEAVELRDKVNAELPEPPVEEKPAEAEKPAEQEAEKPVENEEEKPAEEKPAEETEEKADEPEEKQEETEQAEGDTL